MCWAVLRAPASYRAVTVCWAVTLCRVGALVEGFNEQVKEALLTLFIKPELINSKGHIFISVTPVVQIFEMDP